MLTRTGTRLRLRRRPSITSDGSWQYSVVAGGAPAPISPNKGGFAAGAFSTESYCFRFQPRPAASAHRSVVRGSSACRPPTDTHPPSHQPRPPPSPVVPVPRHEHQNRPDQTRPDQTGGRPDRNRTEKNRTRQQPRVGAGIRVQARRRGSHAKWGMLVDRRFCRARRPWTGASPIRA